MSAVEIAARLMQFLAVGLAIALATRRRTYRPIAWFLAVNFVVDYIRLPIAWAIGDLPTPYTGATRFVFHLDQALLLLWPFGIAAVGVSTFLGRSLRPIAPGYAVAAAAVALGYPTLRKLTLGWAYAAIHAATLVVALACFIAWYRKQYRDRSSVEPEHEAAGLLCASQVAVLAVAPDPFSRWHYAHLSYGLLYLLLVAIEAYALPRCATRAD